MDEDLFVLIFICREAACKASFALSKQIKDMYLNVESTIFLFDSYISSILNYVSEVWAIDKGVNMVYCEMGRLPIRKIRVINYWSKFLSTDNCILKLCYKQLLQDISIGRNWLYDVRDIFYSLGYNFRKLISEFCKL